MAIIPFVYTDSVATDWTITIDGTGVRHKPNHGKYAATPRSRQCQMPGCTGKTRINTPSGLCATHKKHTCDLRVELSKSGTTLIGLPTHAEIVEQLIEWAQSRNYKLEPFFEGLGFNILGNIPDASTLDGKSPLSSNTNISLPVLFNTHVINLLDQFFPPSNSSSYQTLHTNIKKTYEDIPARVLAFIFASLVFVEEANRGDRWFCRTILKDERKTKMLGGAMPIAYFAARRFYWGVEMKKIMSKIFR